MRKIDIYSMLQTIKRAIYLTERERERLTGTEHTESLCDLYPILELHMSDKLSNLVTGEEITLLPGGNEVTFWLPSSTKIILFDAIIRDLISY